MDKVQNALKQRYPDMHPLIFQRSREKAKTNGELFDILETVPSEYPVLWCETERKWIHTTNLLQNDRHQKNRMYRPNL